MALRNLFRHKTRSIISIVMTAATVASIIVFYGQAHRILDLLFTYAVEEQYGHLQIADHRNWSHKNQKLADRLSELSPELKTQIKTLPELVNLFPRLSLQGLISGSDNQFNVRIVGYDPKLETSKESGFSVDKGRALTEYDTDNIVLGTGLSQRLRTSLGDRVSVLAQTIDGAVNATDLTVVGISLTGLTEIDDQTAYVPISVAQKLLDTSKVELWLLRLKNVADVPRIHDQISTLIERQHPGLAIKTWRELADYFNRVEEFYGIQNAVIYSILILLTALAVFNTVGMSVYERTGEIGTLRALGLTRQDIVTQFLYEGLWIGVFGGIVGAFLGAVAIFILNASQVAIEMPGAAVPIVLEADLVPKAFILAALMGLCATMVGTIIPALRASRLSIVDALRTNI